MTWIISLKSIAQTNVCRMENIIYPVGWCSSHLLSMEFSRRGFDRKLAFSSGMFFISELLVCDYGVSKYKDFKMIAFSAGYSGPNNKYASA